MFRTEAGGHGALPACWGPSSRNHTRSALSEVLQITGQTPASRPGEEMEAPTGKSEHPGTEAAWQVLVRSRACGTPSASGSRDNLPLPGLWSRSPIPPPAVQPSASRAGFSLRAGLWLTLRGGRGACCPPLWLLSLWPFVRKKENSLSEGISLVGEGGPPLRDTK